MTTSCSGPPSFMIMTAWLFELRAARDLSRHARRQVVVHHANGLNAARRGRPPGPGGPAGTATVRSSQRASKIRCRGTTDGVRGPGPSYRGADPATPLVSDHLAVAQDISALHDLCLLVLDDLPASTTADDVLELKSLAGTARMCVVAVLDEDPLRSPEQQERAVMPGVDVVLRVDLDHDMPPWQESPRAGEVDLRVVRHRRGPRAVITLAFQGHYARLVDMPSDEPSQSST